MASPYIAEIRCFGFNFAPVGWAFCNGQLLPIANFDALFAVIGTTYGGDGTTTFALPNLQGRVPMHWGSGPGGFNTTIGQVQGTENVTLSTSQIPAHTHSVTAGEAGSGGVVEETPQPNANAWIGNSNPDGAYNTSPTINAPFSPKTISTVGSSQPHDNLQPFLVVNFCIATEGIFPSRN